MFQKTDKGITDKSNSILERRKKYLVSSLTFMLTLSPALLHSEQIFAASKNVKQTKAASSQVFLKPGDKSAEVMNLQMGLEALGCYFGHITGIFDKHTEEAVKIYQQGMKLKVTGTVNKDMFKDIQSSARNYYPKTNVSPPFSFETLDLGVFGDDVQELQRKLRQEGYYKSAVDGYYDYDTEDAVLTF